MWGNNHIKQIKGVKQLTLETPFQLESGVFLPRLELAYHIRGRLSPERDNVVWIYHALTGNSDPAEWWPEIVGDGCVIDLENWCVVCANILGSCYGSSGPTSMNPETGEPFYASFPEVTVRDSVRAFDLLRKHLGIERVALGVGPSLGGQQALEAAITYPDLFQQLLLIATNAQHSPWGIAWNEAQRMAIESDRTWRDPSANAGVAGLSTARAIAMLSYRSYELYGGTQREEGDALPRVFRAASYQRYQGRKLTERFHAQSYWLLSKAMDSHNVGRGRGGVVAALQQVRAQTMVIGIENDLLFPTEEQRFLADTILGAEFHAINSTYGHDGFLIESEQIGRLIGNVLKRVKRTNTIQERRIEEDETINETC
ncbi:MAG: homoserine O-acetyltransferase [Candidatus Kapaibacterium sp.]